MNLSTADPAAGPTSDLDPFDDDFLVDPFPALEELRETGPVVYLPRYDVWAVARHQDVHAVLRDHRRFSSAAGVGLGDLTTDAYSWRRPSLIGTRRPSWSAPCSPRASTPR